MMKLAQGVFVALAIVLAMSKGLGALEEAVIEYTAQDLKDPFEDFLPGKKGARFGEGEQAGGSDLSDFKIEGIVCGPRISHAIINKKVVQVGDKIDGAMVVEISKEGARLVYMGKEVILKPQLEQKSKSQTKVQ